MAEASRTLKLWWETRFDFRIVELQFLQTEKMGLTEDDGKSVFDVYCKDEQGRRFLVEMQMWGQPHFDKRSMIYLSLAVMDQVREAKRRYKELDMIWDYNFESVYVVSFLNQRNDISEDPEDPRANPYISHYITRSIATGRALNDGAHRIFIDLYRFGKTFEECESNIERWLFSIKNMHLLRESPTGVDGTELEDLYIESKLAAWNPDLRTKYERLMATELDREIGYEYTLKLATERATAEAREKALKEGREEGLELGREEGRLEERRANARRMLAKGMDICDVADVTWLTVEEIRAL